MYVFRVREGHAYINVQNYTASHRTRPSCQDYRLEEFQGRDTAQPRYTAGGESVPTSAAKRRSIAMLHSGQQLRLHLLITIAL